MPRLTTQQHRMMEELTGRQLTQSGVPRKYQNRPYSTTERMGLDLYSPWRNGLRRISDNHRVRVKGSGSAKLKEMLARLKEPV